MANPFLVIIGGGSMGGAIAAGGVRAGVLDPRAVMVADPDVSKHPTFNAMGVRTVERAGSALTAMAEFERERPDLQGLGQILLAVKPQMLDAVAVEMGDHIRGRIVVSILAGTSTRRIIQLFGRGIRVVRAMPNLPASIGHGCTAICLGEGTTEEDSHFAHRLFEGVGPRVFSIREQLMDAFTALAGSGPAYLFHLAEAMEKAANDFGFAPEISRQLVRQTLLGSATLLAQSASSASQLRQAVTSKGGTTESALRELERLKVMDALLSAIKAARDRGMELGS